VKGEYMSDQNTALLVIHTQMAFFQAPKPLYQGDMVVASIKSLIEKAHKANVPVIYIQENATGDLEWMNSTPFWNIHPELTPTPADAVLQQWEADVFADQSLQRELDARGVSKLVVAGLQTEHCINNTCRNGAALGYDITLASDGHSTFDNDTATAEQITKQYSADLSSIVTVKTAHEIAF